MRLVNVFPRSQKFPDGSASHFVGLTFEKDGERIVKSAKISTCAAIVNRGGLRSEAAYLIRKIAKEAARDFHYQKHGYDGIKAATADLDLDQMVEEAVLLLCQQSAADTQ